MSIVKQSISQMVFMLETSQANDVRCLSLEIDCEGTGRFFVLRTEKKGSEIYLGSPEDFRMLYEAALTLWRQGDIYAPGDTDGDDLYPLGIDGAKGEADGS